ncbi:hypothetical protein SEA_KEELAN_84 [Gordonia phage Keelan]|nr:hypothetical protein SEA_KEELAN_84 [Gordonia phage Keelan]
MVIERPSPIAGESPAYVVLKKDGIVHETAHFGTRRAVMIDLDKDGEVLGVEFLDGSVLEETKFL